MNLPLNFKVFGIFLAIILALLVVSIYRRPTVEGFYASVEASRLDTKAREDTLRASALRSEAASALETCKALGMNVPEQYQSFNTLLKINESNSADSVIPIFNQNVKVRTVRNCTTELSIPNLKTVVQDILGMKIPPGLSTEQTKSLEKAKVSIASAMAAEAQAKAS